MIYAASRMYARERHRPYFAPTLFGIGHYAVVIRIHEGRLEVVHTANLDGRAVVCNFCQFLYRRESFRLPNKNRLMNALARGTLGAVSRVCILAIRLPLLPKNREHSCETCPRTHAPDVVPDTFTRHVSQQRHEIFKDTGPTWDQSCYRPGGTPPASVDAAGGAKLAIGLAVGQDPCPYSSAPFMEVRPPRVVLSWSAEGAALLAYTLLSPVAGLIGLPPPTSARPPWWRSLALLSPPLLGRRFLLCGVHVRRDKRTPARTGIRRTSPGGGTCPKPRQRSEELRLSTPPPSL